MKTYLRLEIFNLSIENWNKIEETSLDGFRIYMTPNELIDLIGFDGGQFLSGKLNYEERIFVDAYYELGRALAKQNGA